MLHIRLCTEKSTVLKTKHPIYAYENTYSNIYTYVHLVRSQAHIHTHSYTHTYIHLLRSQASGNCCGHAAVLTFWFFSAYTLFSYTCILLYNAKKQKCICQLRRLYMHAHGSREIYSCRYMEGCSVSVWFKYEDSTVSQASIFDFSNGPANNNFLMLRSTTTTELWTKVYIGATQSWSSKANVMVVNSWVHIVWVLRRLTTDRTQSRWYIYINGAF